MPGGGYAPSGGGGGPPGADWFAVLGTYVAAGGTSIVPGGVILWIPPSPGFVRGYTNNGATADPLVGAGGATTVSVGINNYVNALYTSTIATLNNRLQGWGGVGPNIAIATGIGNQDSGVVVAPVGSVPGSAGLVRNVVAVCDVGTVTGTLHFRFEFRPFAGGTF